MTAKKKTTPKKAAPKKKVVLPPNWGKVIIPDGDLLVGVKSLFASTPKRRLRIGSIVRYVPEDTVMIVLWRDSNEFERLNEPKPKARYTWCGINLSNPDYQEFLYVSDKMLEDGEVEIIGHFDFFSLVNGNQNR